MRDYTYSELMAMQEEATRRVHEMQKRAQKTAERAQKEISDYSSQGSGDVPPKNDVNTTENVAATEPQQHEDNTVKTIESPLNAHHTDSPTHDSPAAKQIYPNPHPPRHIPMPSGISQDDVSPLNVGDNVREKSVHSDKKGSEPAACLACKENCPFKSLYNSPLRPLLNNGESADQSLILALLLLIGSDSGDELMMLALLYMMG